MWDFTANFGAVTGALWVAQALCGLSQSLCGLSLALWGAVADT